MQNDPELLEIRINGGDLFISSEGVPLELTETHAIQFRRNLDVQRVNRYALLSKKIQKQLTKGEIHEVAMEI